MCSNLVSDHSVISKKMEVKSNKKALYIVATFTFEMLVSYIHIQLVA